METMPAYTNYTVNFKGTLDHIFYSKDKLEVTHLLGMPDDRIVAKERGLPSTAFPSDHLRIEAVFKIL